MSRKYTDIEKLEIAAAWAFCADDQAVAQGYNVVLSTLKEWKRQPWWSEALQAIQSKQSQRLIARANQACEAAIDNLQDRIDHGDVAVRMTPDGPVNYRIPVKARDLSAVVNVLATRSEKAAALVGQENTQHQLSDLQAALRQFAKTYRAKQVTDQQAIEGQAVRVNGRDSGDQAKAGQD